MGRASSNKKVARAARAAGRPGTGRNLGWPLLVGVIVVLGVLLIVLSRGKTDDATAPQLGDHWHVAYAIYDCDHFIPNLTDVVAQDTTGLHTHGDGLMHLHPFATKYTGKGANIGHWGEATGLDLTDTSIKAAGIDRENGDECDDGKGTLQLKVWDSPTDETGHLIDKDFADYAPQEFSLLTLAFVPEGTDIPKPPEANIEALQAPSDVTGQTTLPSVPPESSTSAPGSTESTEPPATTESTAPGDTTATSEPATTVPTSAP
jgi:hypothetical protein